jgi:two-component system chemotaxis response regulator CheY
VDDSQIIRKIIHRTILMANVPIGLLWNASNGLEALQVINNEWVDLVLLDLNMPVMTGSDFGEKMSEKGLIDKVPVIVVSTEGSESKVERLLEKGARAFVRKPFTPEDIRKTVREVLGEWDGCEDTAGDSF